MQQYRPGVPRLVLLQSPLPGESRAAVGVGAVEQLQRGATGSFTTAHTIHFVSYGNTI